MAKVCIFLADGFEEVEGLTSADLLRRAGAEVTLVSITGDTTVIGANKISVVSDTLFENRKYDDVDMIVLPGGMPGTSYLAEHEGLRALILAFYEKKKWIGAICAAPTILGRMGLLKGRDAVCYPGNENALEGANVLSKKAVTDGHIITGRSAGCAMAFALELIENLIGKEEARTVKEAVVYGH